MKLLTLCTLSLLILTACDKEVREARRDGARPPLHETVATLDGQWPAAILNR